MTKEELSKEIIDSNLSAEAKLQLIRIVLKDEEPSVPTVPNPYVQPVVQPIIIQEQTPRPWWTEVTCGEDSTFEDLLKSWPVLKDKYNWDDSGWWEQHMRDAQGDVESIIHPPFVWKSETTAR